MYFLFGKVHSTLHSNWGLYCLVDFKNQKYGYFEFGKLFKMIKKNSVIHNFSPMDFGDYYLYVSYCPHEYFTTGFLPPVAYTNKIHMVSVPLYRDSIVKKKVIFSPLQIMYFDKFKEYMALDADLVSLVVLFGIEDIYDELILSFRTVKNALYDAFVLKNGQDEIRLLLNQWNTFKL